MRVFLSSTAYDLALLRGHLRGYLESLGHQPVLSDYSDILYDPAQHTHKSCVQELSTCDAVVLVVGSRFGSIARPEFVEELVSSTEVELEKVATLVADRHISVTQLEALTAIANRIPIFTFVEAAVLNDLRVYESNLESAALGSIVFPSIPDPEAARYIFRFIRFLQDRSAGNAVFSFERLSDIESALAKQWSGLLQRLLSTERVGQQQTRLLDEISEQIDDLKGAVLSSIQEKSAREIARGVVQYRFLVEFLIEMGVSLAQIDVPSASPWDALLHDLGVASVYELPAGIANRGTVGIPTVLILREDGSTLEGRMSAARFASLEMDWSSFCSMSPQARRLVYETLSEQFSGRARGLVRIHKGELLDPSTDSIPYRRLL